jgi:hypothetical protein
LKKGFFVMLQTSVRFADCSAEHATFVILSGIVLSTLENPRGTFVDWTDVYNMTNVEQSEGKKGRKDVLPIARDTSPAGLPMCLPARIF